MVYSELEKRIRHREAVRRNRAKNKKKIDSGDKKAILQAEKDKYNTARSHAFTFIAVATKKDLLAMRDKIAERQKEKRK